MILEHDRYCPHCGRLGLSVQKMVKIVIHHENGVIESREVSANEAVGYSPTARELSFCPLCGTLFHPDSL